MSTPENGAPHERYLADRLTPTPGQAPSPNPPTPGIALAAARVPGAPTVPDPEPWSLTQLVSSLANELFSQQGPPSLELRETADAPRSHTAPDGVGLAVPSGAQPPIPSSRETFAGPSFPISPFSGTPSLDDQRLMSIGGTTPEIPNAPLVRPDLAAAASDPSESPPYWVPYGNTELPSADEWRRKPGSEESLPFQLDPIPALGASDREAFDPVSLRGEFPILEERVHGKRLVWLDNAATTQKPRAVIDRLTHFYEHENSNIHRGAHTLAARATDAYEGARESVRRFLNAPSVKEIVFVRGTTEGINLVAQSWGRRHVQAGDELVISWLEHHANIVPWQQLATEKGARLRVAPVDDRGQVLLDEYEKLLGPKTRIVSLTQVSNALGTVSPVREMTAMAHRHGARVLIDGAQSVSHMRVDVQELDCDFFVFSGHKVFAPTGIGALFGKSDVLSSMPPWQGGGNMIEDVTFERTVYQPAPARFEAGTASIGDAVGLGAALDWLTRVGIDNVSRYEHELLVYGTERLLTVPGLRLIGTALERAGVMSFIMEGHKTQEIGGLLDQEGIAVRSGHHCAQPILRRFGLEATVRASLAPYNSEDDLDALVDALRRIQAGTSRG
ncbi:MAG: SufS family cysteine desulfurase [Deltaproteobacteria bacterium]|nr:SufS family cysteine desulfurase [Deltaproteobacteria bacterium]